MLESLLDDVLEMIARRAVARCAEIDDAAVTAASLALVSRKLSAVMSPVAWKAVADAAQLMDPCAWAEARRSACEEKTVRKKDLAAVAVAAKLRRAKAMTLDELEETLDKGDDRVGAACPIPLAAAAYIVRMSFRWMPAAVARVKFGDRDISGCEVRGGSFRFRDLRRAPSRPAAVPEDRTQAIAFLDALFTRDKPRPWWVRSMSDADLFFRRERLVADGYPLVAARWNASDAQLRDFKDVCALMGRKMKDHSHAYGPSWSALSHDAMAGIASGVFMLCRDTLPLNAAFTVAEVERVRAKVAAAQEIIADVPAETLDACFKIMQEWLPARPTVSVATAAILLKHVGLPMAPAWWDIDDETEVLHDLAEEAHAVSLALHVPVHYNVADFGRAVAAAAQAASCQRAPRPANGRFLTAAEVGAMPVRSKRGGRRP